MDVLQAWAEIKRIAAIADKTDSEFRSLDAALRRVGIVPNDARGNPAIDRWAVTLWRPGEGCMTRAHGATIRQAWRRAVWHGRATVFHPADPWAAWCELIDRAERGIKGKPNVNCITAAYRGGIGVEIARMPRDKD